MVDKGAKVWYKEGVRIYAKLVIALVCGVVLSAGEEPEWDAVGLYAQVRMMLEDKAITDVSAVPEMLEKCVEAGFEPGNEMLMAVYEEASKLLLDVYEGDHKGLAAQPEKAFKLSKRLSEQKLQPDMEEATKHARAEAMYRLALYHEKGFGCKASPKEAYKWMRRAAMAELRTAQVELSRYLMNGVGHAPEPRMALMNLRKLALQAPDTPNLFFYLGYMCMNGIGMNRPNLLMAKRCFEYGTERRDSRAINNLGSMYELGIGVKRDVAHALRLYRQAAELGCKDASTNMQRLAYKTDASQRPSASWRQRVGSAALRVVHAMPLDDALRGWIEAPIRRLYTEP